MEKMIYVDLDRCVGCHTCEIECAVEHSESKELFEAIHEEPLPQYRIDVEYFDESNIPWQCRHCEDAPCVTVCPTDAIRRENDESPVVVDDDKCIGCKMCIQVCPFGVLKLSRSGGVVTKCDLCIERLKEGEEPACVEGCPTNALQFMTVEEVSEKKKEESQRELLTAFRKGSELAKEQAGTE